MSLFTFVSALKRILPARATRGQRGRSRDRASLRLEHLEDRWAPATLQVGAGMMYTTIQAAIDAAAAGDTIRVGAGTYAEQVFIDKSLTLQGQQAGVDARGGRPGLGAQESILSLGFGGLQINADHVTVDGFTVTNASSSNTNGLIAGGLTSNYFVLKNTILTDDNAVTGAPILFQGGSHTNMQFSQDLFQDKGDWTFYFGGNAAGDVYDGLTISDSKFVGKAGGVFYAGGNPLTDAVIQRNEFDGTVNGTPGVGTPGLNIGQSVNLTIADNHFHDMDYTAFQVGMIGGLIKGNTFERIYADSGAGFGDVFQLWGGEYGTAVSTNVTIANNTIHYNDVDGATLPTRGIRLRPRDSSSSSGIDVATIHIIDNTFVNGGVLSEAFALVVDVGQEVVNVRPGTIHYRNTLVDYSNLPQVYLNKATAVNAIPGPDTADRSTAFTGLNAQERAVQALYLAALGRAGSIPELDGWANQLPAGATALSPAIVSGIEHSGEAQDHLVRSWYTTFLGRQAQGGEEQGWVNMLQGGQTEEQVLSGILGSGEFFARAQRLIPSGSQQEQYVQALYKLLLDRVGGTGEVSGWTGLLKSGTSAQQVALGFLHSQEFRTDQFDGYYNALLHRPDELGGLNNWVMSKLDMDTVRIQFEAGPEFFANG